MTPRTHRPAVGAAALLLAGLLALAGCGGDDGTDETTDAGGSGLRCSGVALATMSALTGPDAGLGLAVARGAELAVEEFNESNPDCEVRLDQVDTRGEPERAAVEAKGLAADDEVIGVVGPAFSGEALAAGDFLDDAGLPTVTPSATNPALSRRGWSTFHRIPPSDTMLGATYAAYLAQRSDPAPVAVIDDGSTYGVGLADIVETRLGDAVAVSLTVAPGAATVADAVAAVTAAGVGTVFYVGYEQDSATLATALRAASGADLVLSEGAYNPTFINEAGEAAEGVEIVTSTAPLATVPAFAKAFRLRFGASPPAWAAESYDAATAFLAAIEDGARTRSEVAEFLAGADLEGITRPLRWTATGEPVEGRFRLVKVAGGAFVDQGPVPAG